MRRGCELAAAEEAVAKLRSLHYLNDETFARDWAGSRARGRGYGRKRIEQELRDKGIGPALLRDVVSELFSELDETEMARSILRKRFKGQNLGDAKIKRRAAAFLQRRGYGSEVIFELLRYPFAED